MSDDTFWVLVWGTLGWVLAYYCQWRRRKEIIRFNAAREDLAAKVERAEAEVERLREKCDELTINGFSAQLKQLDELRKENARLKDVVAGYSGSGQRITNPLRTAWRRLSTSS